MTEYAEFKKPPDGVVAFVYLDNLSRPLSIDLEMLSFSLGYQPLPDEVLSIYQGLYGEGKV